MGREVEVARSYEVEGVALAKRYAGFVGAEDLSRFEQVVSIATLVPMALEVVEEARDTIEARNDVIDRLRALRDRWAGKPLSRTILWRSLDEILNSVP